MKKAFFLIVALITFAFITHGTAQQDNHYVQYMHNGLFEGENKINFEKADAIVIVNQRNGEVISASATVAGKPIELRKVEASTRGTHYAFVKFENQSTGTSITIQDTDDDHDTDGSTRINTQGRKLEIILSTGL